MRTWKAKPARRSILQGGVELTTAVVASALTGCARAPEPGPPPPSPPQPPAPPPPPAVPDPPPITGHPLWQEFARNPFTHPQIPNVAFAGYRRGEPPPAVKATLDARDFGAVPDGPDDAAAAINRALAAAGAAGGGAVSLAPGRYRIDDVIQVGHPGVVLRGAGSARTVLQAGRSLTEAIGVHRHPFGGDTSAWSWTGGLVWVTHHQRYRALVDGIRATTMAPEVWTGDDPLARVAADAARGAFVLTVEDAGALLAGQRVLLKLDDDDSYGLLRHISGDVPGAASYDWAARTKLLATRPFVWPVQIARVEGRQVTLAQPLPLDARVAWRARLTTTGPVITEAGVEGLTIEMPRLPQAKHLYDPGWNGLLFQCAWDCWADDVRVVDADNAFLVTCAKGVTLARTRVSGRMRHHSYTCREQAHDILFHDFAIERAEVPLATGATHHGINVEGFSCGNVWSVGRMENGTFDTHRLLPFANVRTEIVVENDGSHGGSADAGPLYGARFAHWNVTVANQRAGCVKIDHIAPCSATVAISEVREFGQTDRPDFEGALESRLEGYGSTEVTPGNLHGAQRQLLKRLL